MGTSLALLMFLLAVFVSIGRTELVMCGGDIGTLNYVQRPPVTFGAATTFMCTGSMSRWWRSTGECGEFEQFAGCSELQTQCTISVNEDNEQYFYYCCSEDASELTTETERQCFHINVFTRLLDPVFPPVARFGQTVTVYVPMYAEPQPTVTETTIFLQHENVTRIENPQHEFLYPSSTSPMLVASFSFDIPLLADTSLGLISFQAFFSSISPIGPTPLSDTFPVILGNVPTTTPPMTTASTDPPEGCPACSCPLVNAVLPGVSGLLVGVAIVVIPLLVIACYRGKCRPKRYKVSSSSTTHHSNNNTTSHVEMAEHSNTVVDDQVDPTRSRPTDLSGHFAATSTNHSCLTTETPTPATPGSSETKRLLPETPVSPPNPAPYQEEPKYAVVQSERPFVHYSVGKGAEGGLPGPSKTTRDVVTFSTVSSAGLSRQSQQKNDATYGTHGNDRPLKTKRSDSAITPV